ncbi:histidine kinase dimerization/phospho-acceptor domain-containing protein [Acidovorax sp. RAC01]|uniref:histidine kinase dimerization/phospho-acceptor domain-containing protein n=1 Tax=Acidovorax sp. RAC01 TaxID=1842533 RepID=UPI00083E7865|nr:histidine kinase dimerization/phospho-acceptor domain-containing protein [Acidovorax sp. RAC01]AOG23761.1 his Kinase A domain protein [Acidovorax sp. RAC01]
MLWSLGALALVWASFVYVGYRTGVHEADELTDGHLAGVASLLLNLRTAEVAPDAELTERVPTPWLKAHDYQQSLSVVQWDAQGAVLARSGRAPLPPFAAAEGFANLTLGAPATVWRTFSQWDVARARKIMVLVELSERDELADDIADQMIEPGLWLLPVVALALGLALWRGLRPLYALSADVAALDPASAQRLAVRHSWSEFASVVTSINTLLDRQHEAMVRERRLANEVAHELRTPLSSIALQARALEGELDACARTEAVTRIGQDALRAGHVLNQLLALARASRAELHETKAPVDLSALVRDVCADYAQAAWQRGDDVALVAPPGVVVQGHAVLLDIAVRNLLENALKHTPDGTRIAVEVGQAPQMGAWLQVSDDGGRTLAGEAAAPARRPVDSLHLGHEILRRVADLHGGRFAPAAPGPTFTTSFRLDLPTSTAQAAG